ncbi:ubiquilin-like protein [Tenrec ecaudatus]|uniref:ubiquilin-like protein n=1 Tax=Tenrec ecaudatus TaxID=94439 RepID=UPI003F5A2063
MPHVTARIPRMAQSGSPKNVPADKDASSTSTRVIVKTPGKEQDFIVADDTSVRQFKEKLSAHFNCQTDQIVLVFMGHLLRDHDTLTQRGILDGHTIYLVIKSKHGSPPLAHCSRDMSTSKACNRDENIDENSSGVHQSAGVSEIPMDSPLLMKPEMSSEQNQNLETGTSEHMAQILNNPSFQQFMFNMNLMRQFIDEHAEMQQLVQQNPEVFQILDNSEILWQTLELARNLTIIQEIMQTQPPAPNLDPPQNPQPYLGLETIPGGENTLGQSYADFSDQTPNHVHESSAGNHVTNLLSGQVSEQVQSSRSVPPPSQEQRDQLPHLPTTRVIYTGSCGLSSANATLNRMSHTARVSASTGSTKDQNYKCALQQPAGVPALLSIQPTQLPQEEGQDDISPRDPDQRLEDELPLWDEQTSSQITGTVMQLLMSNSSLAAQVMMLLSLPQLSEQWKQPVLQTQLSDLLVSLANPKASQAILQIEQGLHLLATEAPDLLPWVAPYLWGLGWFPAPSCSYPDMASWSWDVHNMPEPRGPESCHKSEAVTQKLRFLAEDNTHFLQAPEIRFSKQMKYLRAMGFGNHHANLQALIATEGDTNAAIRKLKRSQGF